MTTPNKEELDKDMRAEIDEAIDRYRSDGDELALCDRIDFAISNRNTRLTYGRRIGDPVT